MGTCSEDSVNVDSVVVIGLVLGLGLLLVCTCALLCWCRKQNQKHQFARTETDGQLVEDDHEKTGDGNNWPFHSTSLAYFRYQPSSEPSPLCVICLGSLAGTVETTACGHLFHAECVEQWLRTYREPRCPVCGGNPYHLET